MTKNNYFCDYQKQLKEIEDYVTKVPKHYKSNNPLMMFKDFNILEDFAVGSAIKYLTRYKTKGTPKQDLLKAIHYILMLIKEIDLSMENK